ncbi:aspartate aminotransferase family protein [Verticiella sediminum]|uniref:Aspartate aminotransferase family protein n=1 Tax=Verticiella sediminum TaxID=1247510 RepID=A0A556B1A2_9BURK|nr:aspartate aminotransferase family protein [Verticiella sediminum]TSH98942.1 aspartate aminotransferase family protein [Verticiella sediminum]
MTRPHAPQAGEGDTNQSPRRAAWAHTHVDATTRELLDRDARVFMHQSVSTPCLSAVRKAEGAWIEDMQGRRYLDFHGNNVHHIGYGHPRLKAAIREQMDELPFAPRRYTCEPAIALAEKLTAIAPRQPGRPALGKVLFATGGSDANEIALAYARAATGRFKTISFWDSFHGAGFGARSVGGEEMFRSGPIGPLLPGTEHVPPFGDYRNAWGVREGSAELCVNTIRYVLQKEGDVAAVIAEPTRAVPYVAPPGFWKRVQQACHAFGALLIFDEIPTGLGKTGRMFSCEHDEVAPDILVLGKSLGGGMLPIAAALMREDLDVAGQYAYGHYTHEKNPITTRAALTTLQIIEDEGLVENAARMGAHALARLHDMMSRHRLIGDVRGRGCLFGAELVLDRDSREPASDAADRVLYAALARGLNFKVSMGNVLTFTPPLIVTRAQMDEAMDIVEAAIAEAARELGLD